MTYTVITQEGENPRSGLTLAQAADEILSSDGRDWEIRFDNGVWEIWSRQQVANIGWGKTTISSWADTREAAENELFLEVIENSYDWRGHDIAVTDADYFENIAAA
jgi:hypothetical protein